MSMATVSTASTIPKAINAKGANLDMKVMQDVALRTTANQWPPNHHAIVTTTRHAVAIHLDVV